jgi:hypothetical protein
MFRDSGLNIPGSQGGIRALIVFTEAIMFRDG